MGFISNDPFDKNPVGEPGKDLKAQINAPPVNPVGEPGGKVGQFFKELNDLSAAAKGIKDPSDPASLARAEAAAEINKVRGQQLQKAANKYIVAIVFFIFIAQGLAALIPKKNSGDNLPTETSTSPSTIQTSLKYSSGADKFSISFPGNVTVQSGQERIAGQLVPYRQYYTTKAKPTAGYYVCVYDLSASEAAAAASLDNAMRDLVRNMNQAQLISSLPGTYGDTASQEATFTLHYGTGDEAGYARLVRRGQKLYLIKTLGASQPSYRTFADSLEFYAGPLRVEP